MNMSKSFMFVVENVVKKTNATTVKKPFLEYLSGHHSRSSKLSLKIIT